MKNGTVYRLCRKTNIGVSQFIRGGFGGKAGNNLILILNGCGGCRHLLSLCTNLGGKFFIVQGVQNILCGSIHINGITVLTAAKFKFSGGFIVLGNVSVFRSHLPNNCKLIHIVFDFIVKIGKLQNIIRLNGS